MVDFHPCPFFDWEERRIVKGTCAFIAASGWGDLIVSDDW
jgi:hypothetical protein